MNKNALQVRAGSLIVLSGLPGSGKSTIGQRAAATFPPGFLVSSDALREQILGTWPDIGETGVVGTARSEAANSSVFKVMRTIVAARLAEGLTTVVDACNLDDTARSEWMSLAASAGVPAMVLLVDTPVEECAERNSRRAIPVPAQAFARMKGAIQRTSRFPLVHADSNTELVLAPQVALASDKVDVVGDVHGLLDELLGLTERAGWQVENGIFRHPDDRTLLFLGDVVDRGPASVPVLQLIRRSVLAGTAILLKGNHEKKLLHFMKKAREEGIESWSSYANAETGMAMLALAESEQKTLEVFLQGLPAYAVFEPGLVAFAHGNLHRFDPYTSLQSDMLFGEGPRFGQFDSDGAYEARFEEGLNRYTLVRGHIPQLSVREHVFSLERNAVQRGELALLQLDRFIQGRARGLSGVQAFEAALVLQESAFDFKEHSRKYDLLKNMESLVGSKLATRQLDESGLFRVFKYSKRAFWDNLWDESPWLAKARGLVLDAGGAIVAHPFDKCFNYRENGAGLDVPDDTQVVVVDKLNGHLGVVCAHPHQKGRLLISTQGSFGGDHVQYIKDYLPPAQYGRVCKFLSQNDVTLMFEVLHPADPHIIEYAPEDHGLWLIGVRGKQLSDQPWLEQQVDEAALAMGLRRPAWRRMTKGELLASCRHDEDGLIKLEGWMVRADAEEQPVLFKLKTAYYLVTKFLGRLSDNKAAHLYGHPSDFKKTVDEEFYPLVDALVQAVPFAEFKSMPDEVRVAKVRELLQAQMAG